MTAAGEREHLPWLSADGLTLYFVTDRDGDPDIWRATRASASSPFDAPSPVPELNGASAEAGVTLTRDGRVAILSSDRGTGRFALYRAARAQVGDPFGAPEPIAALATSDDATEPSLSRDGEELFFSVDDGSGTVEIWDSTRSCP